MEKSNAELDEKIIELDRIRELEEPRPPAFSDEALALRFAELHADDLRYVAAWGKWLIVGRRALAVRRDAGRPTTWCAKFAATLPAQCNKPKLASALAQRQDRRGRRAAWRAPIAGSPPSVDQWDADPGLINTRAGGSICATAITAATGMRLHDEDHGSRARSANAPRRHGMLSLTG